MSKTVYLGLSILERSKTVMYEFWYNYVKPKYIYIKKNMQSYVTWIQIISLST